MLSHPPCCPISHVAPGVFSEEEQRLLADDSWPPELRDELVHQLRHLLSLNAPSAMHGFVHDQCENFSFSVFLDLCMISVRVCGMVRERADPTVPPPQPIWRDRPIHGIRHTQAESTKIPWSAIRWPKKTHKCNSWTSLEAPLCHQVGNCP